MLYCLCVHVSRSFALKLWSFDQGPPFFFPVFYPDKRCGFSDGQPLRINIKVELLRRIFSYILSGLGTLRNVAPPLPMSVAWHIWKSLKTLSLHSFLNLLIFETVVISMIKRSWKTEIFLRFLAGKEQLYIGYLLLCTTFLWIIKRIW